MLFQSTLPARGATFLSHHRQLSGLYISIHAPRTGSDRGHGARGAERAHFNPRSPHGERQKQMRVNFTQVDFNPRSPHGERQPAAARSPAPAGFQSTLPARGATRQDLGNAGIGKDFNPRSPHGERLDCHHPARSIGRISIHAPRTGSDFSGNSSQNRSFTFQSTLPARGATHSNERGMSA